MLRTFSCDEMQPEWLQGWIFHIWLVDVIMNDGIRKITFSMDKDKLVHDIPGIFMKKRRLSIRIFYWLCLLKKALVLDDKSRGGVWVLMKFRQKWKVCTLLFERGKFSCRHFRILNREFQQEFTKHLPIIYQRITKK